MVLLFPFTIIPWKGLIWSTCSCNTNHYAKWTNKIISDKWFWRLYRWRHEFFESCPLWSSSTCVPTARSCKPFLGPPIYHKKHSIDDRRFVCTLLNVVRIHTPIMTVFFTLRMPLNGSDQYKMGYEAEQTAQILWRYQWDCRFSWTDWITFQLAYLPVVVGVTWHALHIVVI